MSDSRDSGTGKRPSTDRSRTREEWKEKTLRPALDRVGERDAEFSTVSSLPIERLYTREGSYALVHSQHQAILNAVLERDPEAARQAAHVHLAFVESTLRELDQEAARQERSQRRLHSLLDLEANA